MKSRFILTCLAWFYWLPVGAQGFVNLDFEDAQIVLNDPEFGFLDWNLAVPGWSHSIASDTGIVYYHSTHLGITPAYLLVDSQSPWWSPGSLEGEYSLYFRNGASSYNPGATWVNAFIAQTGAIPADALSIRLLAEGPVAVFIDDIQIPMVSLGGVAYGGDIAALAGSVRELRVVNLSSSPVDPLGDTVTVDAIMFSPLPVPEPTSLALLLWGGMALCAIKRNNCRIGSPGVMSSRLPHHRSCGSATGGSD